MSSTTQFLTFTPSQRHPSRSIAFGSSDRLEVSLGGTCLHRNPHSRFSVQDSPFLFDERTIEPEHATIQCVHGIVTFTHHDRDGTTRINGHPLDRDQKVLLRHDDRIELGYYEPMDDAYTFELFLHVVISLSPPPLSPTRLSSSSSATFLPTSRSVFHTMNALRDSINQLSEELAATQKKLREAEDHAAAHICSPPPPPRPYGALLADLRASNDSADGSDSVPSTSFTSAPSISDSASTSAYGGGSSSVLSSNSSSIAVSSPPSPAQKSATTLVLTSVLESDSHRLSPSPSPLPFPLPPCTPGFPSSPSTALHSNIDVRLGGHSLNDAVAIEIGDGVTRGCGPRSIGSSSPSPPLPPLAPSPTSSPTRNSQSPTSISVGTTSGQPLPFISRTDVPQTEPIDTALLRVGSAWLEARRRVHAEGQTRRCSLNVALDNISAALCDVRGAHHSSLPMPRHPQPSQLADPFELPSSLVTDRTPPWSAFNDAARGRVSPAGRVTGETAFMDTFGGSRSPKGRGFESHSHHHVTEQDSCR
ncbi:hypothetical protein CF319_g2358 [Tilletia indica]|nr:hypothetical protein CF319_g2358 [Tilletia indica]